MKPYETDATMGRDGVLKLQNLPFAVGETVHVRIERSSEITAAPGERWVCIGEW